MFGWIVMLGVVSAAPAYVQSEPVRAPEGLLTGHLERATLLEHDADGVKYSFNAPLAEAASELLEARKLPGYTDNWDDELLTLLGMSGQFEKIPALVADMKPTDSRRSWLLAAAYFKGGAKAARAAAARLSLDRSSSLRAFYGAAGVLELSRQYDQAKKLMALSTVAPADAANRAEHLRTLSRIKQYEHEVLEDDNPADAVRRMMVVLMRPAAGGVKWEEVVSRTSQRLLAREPQALATLEAFGSRQLTDYTGLGYPVDEAIDIVLAHLDVAVEGSAQDGYRVRVRTGDAEMEAFFVVENGEARLLATSSTYALAGPEALARVSAGLDEEAAVALLNWARRYVDPSGGASDPLAAPLFPRFWPGAEVKHAAAALASSVGDPQAESVLLQGRSAATTDARRMDFDIALASVYFSQRDWKKLAPVAERLSRAFPDSAKAIEYRTSAHRGLEDSKQLAK